MHDDAESPMRVAITGGTSGLGLALVHELSRRGARVAFVARTHERVDQVARDHPGTHGASKAALRHMSAIWGVELAAEGVRFLSLDPGDMDTPLHALAVPGADPATLKRPETAAREVADAISAALITEHA